MSVPMLVKEFVTYASFVAVGLRYVSLEGWRAIGRPGVIAVRQPQWKPASRGEIADLFASDLIGAPLIRVA